MIDAFNDFQESLKVQAQAPSAPKKEPIKLTEYQKKLHDYWDDYSESGDKTIRVTFMTDFLNKYRQDLHNVQISIFE